MAHKNFILRLISNPMGLYLLWIIVLILFFFIGIPILSVGHSGGEQRPLTLLGYVSDITIFGFILISLVSPILYWKWYKKHSFVLLIVPILITGLLSWLVIRIYISNGYNYPF
ncbi:MAG: hypothetical protein V4592_19675 [Bacteroidota bacterium]